MELICRIIMMLCFDLAALALVLVLRLAKGGRERGARCLSACLALGFLCGGIARCLTGMNVLISLEAAGFLLSDIAFLLTFQDKRAEVTA